MSVKTFEKDPNESLDYGFNLTKWLTGSEQIVSGTFTETPDNGVTVGPVTTDGKRIWAMIGGGTAGALVTITVQATTDSSPARVFERSFAIRIEER